MAIDNIKIAYSTHKHIFSLKNTCIVNKSQSLANFQYIQRVSISYMRHYWFGLGNDIF